MPKLRNFARRPPAQRLLILESAWRLTLARLRLAAVPFSRIAPDLGEHNAESDGEASAEQREFALLLARAIGTAARVLPWQSKCLVQALAGQAMLSRRGLPCTLYLGVARDEDADLAAHAWLRVGDVVVTGGAEADGFKVVSTFAGRGR